MNGLAEDSCIRAGQLADFARPQAPRSNWRMVLCPPATVLAKVHEAIAGSGILLGGQDCHDKTSGAYTGNISADMLKDAGCSFVILGHSERRQYQKETDAEVAAKALAAHAAGISAIICVGETDAERMAGLARDVVTRQLAGSIPTSANAENTAIAYEPVWAIGTGKTASGDDIAGMHAHIRQHAGALPILYGGSVKPDNAREILHIENVDGVLVGGASLKVEDFIAIAAAS